MEYPKPVMKKSELKEMGFSDRFLMTVFYRRNQKVAWKASNAQNSPILFDTAELEKIRIAQCTGR